MAAEQGVPVELYIYDLTNGLASLLSPTILGRQIEGVWHTAVVVYQREYFYGGGGITNCSPGSTQLGAPLRVERLGETFVPYPLFVDYLHALSSTTYTPGAYSLLQHNCNHFSEELAGFLCGSHVPKHILSQPDELLAPPARAALQHLLDSLVPSVAPGPANGAPHSLYRGARHPRQDSPEFLTLNSQIEEARVASVELDARRHTLAEKLARKERRRDKKRRKRLRDGDTDEMAEAVEVSPGAGLEELSLAGSVPGPSSAGPTLALEADERRAEEQRRRARDPPIVYTDIDGVAEFGKLVASLERVELSAEERVSLDELQQYLVQGEGSWVLGDDFLLLVARLLGEDSPGEARVATLRCLAACALREDVSLVLHQDRRHHALLNYAQGVDALPLPEQEALALLMCNLFENISSSEWLLYISEWEYRGQPLSNIRATTKVCVHCTLSAEGSLRELGTALMYNIAAKEVKTVVFDEVCVELCMALLQLLSAAPAEEHLYRAVRALARLAAHSGDVPQLIALVGPSPDAYRGTSPRVDEQIDLIMSRVK